MKKVAIYTRISTSDQNISMQLNDLRAYSNQRGYQIFGEYNDVSSGANEKRSSLNRLMNNARKRFFDIVLVWRFGSIPET